MSSEASRGESLDAAWADAEAALPEGWTFEITRFDDRCEVVACDNWGERQALTSAPTPAAALRTLAMNLRERVVY